MRQFDDFEVGQVFEFGPREVTEEEILRFAREYDPQPFHVDPEAAEESPFSGLIASGWHSVAMFMRMYVDTVLEGCATMGSPGVEELRWLVPVRPGDVLHGRVTVLKRSPSSIRPDRGTLHLRGELLNQDGEVVMTIRMRGYVGRRAA
jgi:acyl dehydratase